MARGKTESGLAYGENTTQTGEAMMPAVRPRVYQNQGEVDHDVFKLLPSEMRKDVSWSDQPRYEYFVHSHIFHTVDSSGKKLGTSAPVGGHFHVMTVEQSENGVPEVRCSKPMKYVKQMKNGQPQKVAVEIEDDDHVHQIQYLGSERIKLRQINPESVKLQSMADARARNRVDGIVG